MLENELKIRLSWLAEQTLAQAEKELFQIPRYVWIKEANVHGKNPFLVGSRGAYLPSSGTRLRLV